jgi:catechol 2,3-dioxygenase
MATTPIPSRPSASQPDPAASRAALPAALSLGPVTLKVIDLNRSVAWYQRSLGLKLHRREPTLAELGDGRSTVVILRENRAARASGRHAGLYHYALLYPSRAELARAAIRLVVTRTPIQGASDHGTHEAIYLADPDGLGIELAADRERELWPTPEEEFSRGGPRPLDLPDLLSVVESEQPTPQVEAGLRVGHLHLHVGSIDQGLAFYRDLIGFEVWAQLPTAAFVSAGGYHHHLGFNTWRGEGLPPAPADAVGLHSWTIELPGGGDVAQVRSRLAGAGIATDEIDGGFLTRDPWSIPVQVRGQTT